MESGSDGRVLRPSLNEKFRAAIGKRILEQCANELLTGQKFSDANITELSKTLAENVRKELIVIIGEQRGQGARIHTASCWDIDTDSQVTHFYQNDSLFCEIIVFAVFTYS